MATNVVITVEYPLRVNDIAGQTGVSPTSVRRYLKQFSEFVPSTTTGRGNAYAPEAIDIVRRVNDLYADGTSTSEIYRILTYEFSMTVAPDTTGIVPLDNAPDPALDEIRTQIDEFVEMASVFIAKTQKIEQHDADIQTLQTALATADTAITTLTAELDDLRARQETSTISRIKRALRWV